MLPFADPEPLLRMKPQAAVDSIGLMDRLGITLWRAAQHMTRFLDHACDAESWLTPSQQYFGERLCQSLQKYELVSIFSHKDVSPPWRQILKL